MVQGRGGRRYEGRGRAQGRGSRGQGRGRGVQRGGRGVIGGRRASAGAGIRGARRDPSAFERFDIQLPSSAT